MNDLKQMLRSALIAQFRLDRDKLDDDTPLFSSGLIDSLSVMDLVCRIEDEIGRSVPPTAITLQNFDSIARIEEFVNTLTAAGKAG